MAYASRYDDFLRDWLSIWAPSLEASLPGSVLDSEEAQLAAPIMKTTNTRHEKANFIFCVCFDITLLLNILLLLLRMRRSPSRPMYREPDRSTVPPPIER